MKNKTDDLLTQMKEGAALTKAQRFRLVLTLSIPAILAQIASVVMGYIDAAMVGRLGAEASASISLVSSSTWLFGGMSGAVASGFSIQAAYHIVAGALRGAGDTLVPSIMNFGSIWLVRLPLAVFLTGKIGLKGAWIAMCLELCFRGTIFLIRLYREKWMKQPVVRRDD